MSLRERFAEIVDDAMDAAIDRGHTTHADSQAVARRLLSVLREQEPDGWMRYTNHGWVVTKTKTYANSVPLYAIPEEVEP